MKISKNTASAYTYYEKYNKQYNMYWARPIYTSMII